MIFSKEFIIKWIVLSVSMLIASLFFRQRIRIIGVVPILVTALIIAPLNIYYYDIAKAIGIPNKIYYLVIGSVILNAVAIYYSSYIVPDFRIESFSVAVFLAMFMTGINYLLVTYI